MKPCINRPRSTVVKYMPSCPTIASKLSISIIFADTRKKIPTGDTLLNNKIYY